MREPTLPGVRCVNCGERLDATSIERCERCGRRHHTTCRDYHESFECAGATDAWVGSIEF